MNWYNSPRAVDALAAEYVLGTLRGRARRRFEAVMARRPELARAVESWEVRLHRMAGALPPVAPSPALWASLQQRTGAGQAAAEAPAAVPAAAARAAGPTVEARPGAAEPAVQRPPPARSATPAEASPPRRGARRDPPGTRLATWWRQFLAPVPAAALAFGLLAGVMVPQLATILGPQALQDTELPESYVGVLARPDGQAGLIVASRRHGRVVDLKQVSPLTPPAGQTLFLWTIDAAGRVAPVGPVPHGPFVQAPLADTAEQVFRTAAELGVTLEPTGSSPAAPSGPWVYRGLCGKVWRVPAPGAR